MPKATRTQPKKENPTSHRKRSDTADFDRVVEQAPVRYMYLLGSNLTTEIRAYQVHTYHI